MLWQQHPHLDIWRWHEPRHFTAVVHFNGHTNFFDVSLILLRPGASASLTAQGFSEPEDAMEWVYSITSRHPTAHRSTERRRSRRRS